MRTSWATDATWMPSGEKMWPTVRPRATDDPQRGGQDLLARADQALYRAKQAGRNQVAQG